MVGIERDRKGKHYGYVNNNELLLVVVTNSPRFEPQGEKLLLSILVAT